MASRATSSFFAIGAFFPETYHTGKRGVDRLDPSLRPRWRAVLLNPLEPRSFCEARICLLLLWQSSRICSWDIVSGTSGVTRPLIWQWYSYHLRTQLSLQVTISGFKVALSNCFEGRAIQYQKRSATWCMFLTHRIGYGRIAYCWPFIWPPGRSLQRQGMVCWRLFSVYECLCPELFSSCLYRSSCLDFWHDTCLERRVWFSSSFVYSWTKSVNSERLSLLIFLALPSGYRAAYVVDLMHSRRAEAMVATKYACQCFLILHFFREIVYL